MAFCADVSLRNYSLTRFLPDWIDLV